MRNALSEREGGGVTSWLWGFVFQGNSSTRASGKSRAGSSAVLFLAACVMDRSRRVVTFVCYHLSPCLAASRGDVSQQSSAIVSDSPVDPVVLAAGCEIRARCSAIALRSLGVARCYAASFLPGPVAPGRLHGTRWWWGATNLELKDPFPPANGAYRKQGTGRSQGAAGAGVATM